MKRDIISGLEIEEYAEKNRECNELTKWITRKRDDFKRRLQADARTGVSPSGITLVMAPAEVREYSDGEILAAIMPSLTDKMKRYVIEQQALKRTQYALKCVDASKVQGVKVAANAATGD